MVDATFTHASVNTGTAVTLAINNVSFGWSNLIKADPATSKYDIVPADKVGFENPKLTISGVIDQDAIPTNGLTQALLTDFAALKSTTAIEFKLVTAGILTGAATAVLGGQPTAGYSSSGANTLDTTNGVAIIIDSFDLSISSSDSKEGQIWRYNLNVTETS